jgi:hypothetical protein
LGFADFVEIPGLSVLTLCMGNIAQPNRRLAEALEIGWILADYPESFRRRCVPTVRDVEVCEVQPDERQKRVSGRTLLEELVKSGYGLLL